MSSYNHLSDYLNKIDKILFVSASKNRLGPSIVYKLDIRECITLK